MSGFDLRSVITALTAATFFFAKEHKTRWGSFLSVPGNSACVPGQYHASCRIAEGFHSQKHQSALLVVRPVADREVGEANIASQDCQIPRVSHISRNNDEKRNTLSCPDS